MIVGKLVNKPWRTSSKMTLNGNTSSKGKQTPIDGTCRKSA